MALSTWRSRLRQIDVSEGEIGDWQVVRFEVTEGGAALHNLRAAFRDGRAIRPGTYTRLTRRGRVVMSDTQAEIQDHFEPVRRARGGRVLVNGLGLGVVLQAVPWTSWRSSTSPSSRSPRKWSRWSRRTGRPATAPG